MSLLARIHSMRRSLNTGLFVLLLLVHGLLIYAWWPHLPEVMASHFAGDGAADGWMSKQAFFLVTTVCGVGPLALVGGLSFLRRNMTDELRVRVLEFANVSLIGCNLLLHTVCKANVMTEPRLPDAFLWVFLAYMAYVAVWTFFIIRDRNRLQPQRL